MSCPSIILWIIVRFSIHLAELNSWNGVVLFGIPIAHED